MAQFGQDASQLSYQPRETELLTSDAPRGNGVHQNMMMTVYEGAREILQVNLAALSEGRLTFGSDAGNDLVIPSRGGIVSRRHGSMLINGSYVTIFDERSTNGLMHGGRKVSSAQVGPGDMVTIGAPGKAKTIMMLFSSGNSRWDGVSLAGSNNVTIGRGGNSNLKLPRLSVSMQHAIMRRDVKTGEWFIKDCGSFNGTYVNGVAANDYTKLNAGCTIMIANVPLVFLGNALLVNAERGGVDLVASHLYMERKQRGGTRLTTQDVSLHIHPGEFVAIIGGSGSGKSTLLNELNGTDAATRGQVFINGVDLYENYATMKNSIGYVPQQDIVYDNLRVEDALNYSAELRMPPDTTKEDRDRRVSQVLAMLELERERENFIGRLSGGQKKRASIAVELLADPQLLFLDEPTSGLDPGIESTLMEKLASMAHAGRTIILVTHTVANLDLCDKIIFMGAGGKLCYVGPPREALDFFGVDDYAKIYKTVETQTDSWATLFAQREQNREENKPTRNDGVRQQKTAPFLYQLKTLTARYAQLVINDKARLALLLLQAPLLAALICLVVGTDCFSVYEDTKSCLFAISCAAFWVGILNAIQEICKERDIYLREYAGGMSIGAYVFSKVIVLGALCFIQSVLLTTVFCLVGGVPTYAPGVNALINPALEMFVTVLLTTLSAMCLGLLVSSLFQNPDRAIAMAPLLIMPQILFSGLIFELKGASEAISNFVNCRWSMEAFGTTANLNALDYSIVGEEVDLGGVTIHNVDVEVPATTTNVDTAMGQQTVDVPAQNTTIDTVTVPDGTTQSLTTDMYPHDAESAFTFTVSHLMTDWGILLLFCVVCVTACWGLLFARTRR